ncbi:sugar phosphate isomerase/epimerase [Nanchangia anserum]|uniref:sugar phosphate isomerase/epimerase n=1 Tax=Nanchangia anserum TaxID=2692125 RepID=UPI001D0F9202|nr:sugar phosphate isomerase/epimerase [Nanchangia anserum]
MPGQPDLPDSFYDSWKQLMATHGTVATAHDLFLDTKLYPDRLLSHDEMVDSLKRDIRHTAKLEASYIRIIVNTPPEVVEAAAPYARDLGVWMGVEIHSPFHFERRLDQASPRCRLARRFRCRGMRARPGNLRRAAAPSHHRAGVA